jgi:hypothetical protein
MSVQEVTGGARTVEFKPVQGSDVDVELERSLTHEWDAQIITYPKERFPFSEWILNRIRAMGYPVDDLNYFHKVVPQPETFRVTKQLCADTNLPEFRRMVNRFVREVAIPKGKLRPPADLPDTGAPAALHAAGLQQEERPHFRLGVVRSRGHAASTDIVAYRRAPER